MNIKEFLIENYILIIVIIVLIIVTIIGFLADKKREPKEKKDKKQDMNTNNLNPINMEQFQNPGIGFNQQQNQMQNSIPINNNNNNQVQTPNIIPNNGTGPVAENNNQNNFTTPGMINNFQQPNGSANQNEIIWRGHAQPSPLNQIVRKSSSIMIVSGSALATVANALYM